MVRFYARGEAATQAEQHSLQESVKKRLLEDVFTKASDTHPGWKILVVDKAAMRVVSAAVGMYDMMERKVTIVESLEKKRAPFPDKGVIYIMEPTEESVDMLLEDYRGRKPLYGNGVFIYFLSRVSDEQLERIKHCRPLLKRVKGLSEINLNFLAVEDRAFTCDMREAFPVVYSQEQGEESPAKAQTEEDIANKLVTVCATMNEFPHIRYRSSSAVCTSLSQRFHEKMNDYIASNPKWWYYGGKGNELASSRDRGVLLLLDRADDCLSPLMHDFHYQTMVRDLFEMEGDKMTYEAENAEGEKEPKDVLLNEKDELWVEYRGKHIATVIKEMGERISEVTESDTAKLFGGGGDGEQTETSMAQMAAAMKNMPEYREVVSKLSQHLNTAKACMDAAGSNNLMQLAVLEQTFTFGTDDEGDVPKLDDELENAEQLLNKMTDTRARLRLILILTISQGGLSSQDRRRMLNAAELSRHDLQTLNALEPLGIPIFSSASTRKITSFSGLRNNDSEDEEFAGTRYKPVLKSILTDMLVDESLSFEEYPSVLPMPEATASTGAASSARRKKGGEGSARRKNDGGKWNQKGGRKKTDHATFTGGRAIVFMVGGLCYSELRVTREIMSEYNREVVIGSTSFVNAEEFMEDLSTLVTDG